MTCYFHKYPRQLSRHCTMWIDSWQYCRQRLGVSYLNPAYDLKTGGGRLGCGGFCRKPTLGFVLLDLGALSPVPFVPGPKDQGRPKHRALYLGRPSSLSTVPYGPVRCRRIKDTGPSAQALGPSALYRTVQYGAPGTKGTQCSTQPTFVKSRPRWATHVWVM